MEQYSKALPFKNLE